MCTVEVRGWRGAVCFYQVWKILVDVAEITISEQQQAKNHQEQ
jgi:hypothetical protein